MKNILKRVSALFVAVVVSAAVLCPAAFAATANLPDLPSNECVVDDANVLSSSTTDTITELNAELQSSCSGATIGVLTVEYTGNLSTEDYALQAFNTWGIGSSSENNGVLILLVMESPEYEDGDYYLTYGDGFRNTTLDKQASAIAQTMEDDFASQDYDGAVTTCAQNVAQTIADIYGVTLSGSTGYNGNDSYNDSYYNEPDNDGGSVLTDIVALIISVVLIIIIISALAYTFSGPLGWLFWCFGGRRGPRPPRRPRGPRGPHDPPPPGGGYYGGGFGGGPRGPRPPRNDPPRRNPPRGGGGFGGGSFGGGSFGGGGGFHGGGGGSFGGMGGGMSHGGGGGRGR